MTANGRLGPGASLLSEPVPATLREAMSRFATGITVLTTGGRRWHGMTANAFTSVSLEPPLVLVCVARTAQMHDAIGVTGSFAVSILGADQQPLARHFTDRSRPLGIAQFGSVGWRPGPETGAPLLTGALAWLECEVAETFGGGDHSIFLGRVLASTRGAARQALVFFDGTYRQAAR